LFSKYEITKQKAEIKKDVYLINETKMQKGEEKLSSSVQEFLRKIKKSSEEISSKCLNSTENLKMFSETFIAKFQKFHNVLGAQKEVNKEALVLRSGDNKQNFSKDKFIIENKEESSLRKSLFNKEPENEVPNENNSLIINKSFDYNSSKTQDKIKRIISQRSVTKDLTLDTAEDLVKYYTNEKVQEDSERLEPNTDESVCLNPIIGKTFRGSLRTAESRD